MIISCNSCEKKFNVPDGAIGVSGRLVQCSSCGNKWTQYPLKKEDKILDKVQNAKKLNEKPKTITAKKKKKKKKNEAYTSEYLKNKHGIKIIDPSSLGVNKTKKVIHKSNFGFYNWFFTIIIFVVTLLGVVHLSREIISLKFPFLEVYINHLFETIHNIKTIIVDFIS